MSNRLSRCGGSDLREGWSVIEASPVREVGQCGGEDANLRGVLSPFLDCALPLDGGTLGDPFHKGGDSYED